MSQKKNICLGFFVVFYLCFCTRLFGTHFFEVMLIFSMYFVCLFDILLHLFALCVGFLYGRLPCDQLYWFT